MVPVPHVERFIIIEIGKCVSVPQGIRWEGTYWRENVRHSFSHWLCPISCLRCQFELLFPPFYLRKEEATFWARCVQLLGVVAKIWKAEGGKPWIYFCALCIFRHITHFLSCLSHMPIRTVQFCSEIMVTIPLRVLPVFVLNLLLYCFKNVLKVYLLVKICPYQIGSVSNNVAFEIA